MSDLTELKRKFIVSSTQYDEERVPKLIERMLKYCKVDDKGRVIFENPDLTTRERVKAVMLAKFLASKLDENISADMDADDISTSANIPRDQAIARANEFVSNKYFMRIGKARYAIAAFSVDKILNELDSKYGGKNGQ